RDAPEATQEPAQAGCRHLRTGGGVWRRHGGTAVAGSQSRMTKNMDIIEQAAKRLAELRRAGVEPAPEPQLAPASVTPAAVAPPPAPGAGEAAASMSRRVELDMARRAAKGIVTPDAARSNLADELRVVKRPLLRNAAG